MRVKRRYEFIRFAKCVLSLLLNIFENPTKLNFKKSNLIFDSYKSQIFLSYINEVNRY